MDYNSPKDLSEYLIYLDKNTTAYNSYFKWKKHVNFIDNMVTYGFICEMCIHLHMESFFGITPKKTIGNFDSYWNKRDCIPPEVSFA